MPHRSRNQEAEAPDEEEQNEMIGHLTEAEKLLRERMKQEPMQNVLKYLEMRWTRKGRRYVTEPKDDEIIEDKSDWHEMFALCVTHEYDYDNTKVVDTSLKVNSPALKGILKRLISSFPGISFQTSTISINFPPRSLYHYLPELETELSRLREGALVSDESRHLALLVNFTREHFQDVIEERDNFREQGIVSFRNLWTIFKPDSLVYSVVQSQPRVFKLSSYSYDCGQHPGLQLQVVYVDFDGDNFGTRQARLFIPLFSGTATIHTLSALPLELHPEKEAIINRLVQRGRRWEAHAGQQFRQYNGVATDTREQKYNVDSRVMIDARTFHRIEANSSFNTIPFQDLDSKKRNLAQDDDGMDTPPTGLADNFAPLSDDRCLIASPMIRGFSFTEKKFLDFFIDKVSDIEWNTECFDQLVLPLSQKELVQALVTEHTQRGHSSQEPGFDDIVKGKSRGLILVLHGPPGVGKTLTAECVAEFSKRPLYSVSSGDLHINSGKLDEHLQRTLDLASTWKAVLLIDEADVFLERRSLHDMERNGMVSVFLRTLEYYSGIMFMTTNRVRTFDDAFKSRIHVPLRYGSLPKESRSLIWRHFLDRAGEGVAKAIGDHGCAELAETNLNGRQIKNVVRTAKSLSAYKKQRLDLDQLKQVMDIQQAFERDLDATGGDIDEVER